MANIAQIGPRSFRVLIRRKGIKTICRTFKTEKEAKLWAAQTEATIAAGYPVKPKYGVTVGQAIYAYRVLRETGSRPISAKSNETYMLAHLERDLGDVTIDALIPQRLAQYAKRRQKDGAGKTTVNMEVSKLGTVLKYAAISLNQQWGDPVGAARPLLDHLGLIGTGRSRDRRPSADELKRLRRKLAPLMVDIVDFAILTCMRRGEIVNLQWSDIDSKKKLILVRDRKHPRKKAGNDEWVPLLGDSLEILQRQPIEDDDRIFPVTGEWVSDSFTMACKICEIEDLHFHDLRHEGISRLFEAGYQIQEVALVSGHRSWTQLRRYTQLRPESLHSVASGLNTRPRL
jgi:integrase